MREYLESTIIIPYLWCMPNKIVTILGERLSTWFNLHTTEKLIGELRKEAVEKDISANAMLNTILYDRYFRKQKTTK